MNLLQHRYQAWIVPYAEGTLDARRRAILEARLAHDPVLAAEAEVEQRVVARLRAAARPAETSGGGRNLWPEIEARLQTRRIPIRPLILVGSLSAAATSLAWAALWGPLHTAAPVRSPAVTAQAGGPQVIVVGLTPGHKRPHPSRQTRHGSEHLAKRPARPFAGPEGAAVAGIHDEDRLAHTGAPVPTADHDAVSTTPVPGSAGRFHLATDVRPFEQQKDDTGAPAPEETGSSAAGNSSGPASSAVEPVPAAAPMQPEGAAVGHRVHSRRRPRSADGTRSGADASAGVPGPGTSAAPVVPVPPRPKAARKPID